VANPVFGLAAAFLVLGDAGRLLEVDPQLLRLGFDQARNHPLLDNRVTARPEPGAKKNIGDVTSATAGAVE